MTPEGPPKPKAIVLVCDGVAEAIYAPPDFEVQIFDLDDAADQGRLQEVEGEAKAAIDFEVSQESFYTLERLD